MRHLPRLIVLLGMQIGVNAQQPDGLTDLSPDFMFVAALDAAKGHVRLKINQYREQEVYELAVGNVVSLKTEKVLGLFRGERFLTLKDCKVLEASGKVIAPADYQKRLKVGAVVLVTTEGKPPAKAFLNLIRPETVIVVGPPVKPSSRVNPFPKPAKSMPK